MYIYHLIPEPFHGQSLIPLNQMDPTSLHYKKQVAKYEGREELMNTFIPRINCKWNDVIHFSCIDPKIIVNEIKKIKPDLYLRKAQYFKIHIDQIVKYEPKIFLNLPQESETFEIHEKEVIDLTLESYLELKYVPERTIAYWQSANSKNLPLLWFAHMPHIFINKIVDTTEFERVEL